jgi:hypothetical protein
LISLDHHRSGDNSSPVANIGGVWPAAVAFSFALSAIKGMLLKRLQIA